MTELEITLRVKQRYSTSDEPDTAYELYRAIEDAIRWGNPAGKHLSDTAVRTMTEAVLETLGVTFEDTNPFRRPRSKKQPPVVDPMRGVRKAVAALVNFTPEGGYIDELAAAGFEHDNVGFFGSVEEYREYLDARPPLFADPVIYAVLSSGKHDGRTVKGLVRSLCDAAGLELKDKDAAS